MASETVDELEKELLAELSDYHRSEEYLQMLARKYRIAVFGPGYKNPKPVGDTCSFCGKSASEVKKLVAGPAVFICNECVTLCNQIIGDEG